jgi:hypothetical protein
MRLPDTEKEIGDFTVESCTVNHEPSGYGRYEYPFEIVLEGKGGQQGVRNAFRNLLSPVKTTFSAYGNAYQLRFGKTEIESLGNRRYRLRGTGLGARIFLRKELERFWDFLSDDGLVEAEEKENNIKRYLDAYQMDARRKYPDRDI